MKRRKRWRSQFNKEVTGSWLLTYSDMITLCLTFFVLLFSFSTLDNIKWKAIVSSFQGALGPLDSGTSVLENSPPASASETPNGMVIDPQSQERLMRYHLEMEKLEMMREQMEKYLSENGLAATVVVNMEERGLVVRFQDSVLFESARAELLSEATAVLDKVASALQGIANPIRIEGHTDNLPINTPRFPSNWELSTARATSVLKFLAERGLDQKRLSAVGYGEFHPIAPNDSDANRQKNRRVDVVIIRESLIINEPK